MAKLVIMRHGSAAMMAPRDALRPLTENGEQEVHRACRHFPVSPSVIYHSSLLRAQQTASILSSYYPSAVLIEVDWLVPEAEPVDTLHHLGDIDGTVAIVSHQPLVSSLAALLLHGNMRYSHEVPFLRPANFLQLSAEVFEASCAELVNTYL